MLVITRMDQERVCIGDPRSPLGWVKVCKIGGGRVRLGFDFPEGVQVHREEVAKRIVVGVEQPKVGRLE